MNIVGKEESVIDEKYSDSLVSLFMRPFIAFGVVMAFSAQPLMQYANPFALSISGFVTSLALAYLIVKMIQGKPIKQSTLWIIAAAISIGLTGFVGTMAVANRVSERLDHQCGLLEVDMMRLKHARSDSRELYETLKCRPQSRGTLFFPSGKGFV